MGIGLFGAVRLRESAPPLCQGGQAKFAETWGEEKRRATHERFLGTGLAYAEGTWEQVSRSLDAYGRDWAAMHAEACEATRVRGEQSDEVLSLRMLCLDRRLSEVRALTDLLTAADAKATTKAADAVSGLTGLSICADVEALRTPVRAPEGKAAAAAREIEDALARAKAHVQLAQYKEALDITSQAVLRAAALKYPPIEAEALLMEGTIRLDIIDPKAAEQSLRAAYSAAQAGRHDRVAARASIELIFVVGSQLFRFEDAAEWAFHASSALRRLGGDSALEARMHANVGSLLHNKGDFGGARLEYEKSLSIREKTFGPEHREVVQSLGLVAMAARAQGDFAKAAELSRRSTDLSKKLYGARHPAFAENLRLTGVGLKIQERDAEAALVLEEALSVVEAARGRDHPQIGTVLLPLAEAKRSLGRHQEALDAAKRALAIFEAVEGARPFVADCLTSLGDTQREMGQLEPALAMHEKALAIREEVYGPEHESVAVSLAGLGAVLLRQGKAGEGLARYTKALALWEKGNGPDFVDNADALMGMGEARLMLGEPASAIPLLERAQALIEKYGGRPALLAKARSLLARARLKTP